VPHTQTLDKNGPAVIRNAEQAQQKASSLFADTMMTPMQIGGGDGPDERRSRNRNFVIVAGVLLLAAFLGRSLRSDSYAASPPIPVDPFADVPEDEQEDFLTTSKRSSINTAKLPYVTDFHIPTSPAGVTKPKLYLHVGPVRTGVAKLRDQLLAMKDDLLADKVVDSDQLDSIAFQSKCQLELNSARESYQAKKTGWLKKQKGLKGVLENEIPCWNTFLKSLEPYNQEGMSVIISDDVLTQQLLDVRDIGTAVMDWIAIQETLMEKWDVVIVATYRRYFDWMPAGKSVVGTDHIVFSSQLGRQPKQMMK
jgi:hypothetical protein